MRTAAPADLSSVVERGLGLRWRMAAEAGLGPDEGVSALAGLALRDNPKRAQLVVSTVLAKHLPVTGERAEQAGHDLGRRVAALLGDGPPPVVLGYCETATALGQLVAEAMPGASYVHTTRRPDPSVVPLGGFEEEHSHATSHVLQPRDRGPLSDPTRPLVLVDDELTTGNTLRNTLAVLPRHDRVVVATLLDLRSDQARQRLDVPVVALLSGELVVPPDVQERAAVLRAELADVAPAPVPDGRGRVLVHEGRWPAGLPVTGRTGLSEPDRREQLRAVEGLLPDVSGSTLVLGTEELLRVPLRLAALLGPGAVVHSTTRSPVLAADVPGYAVRRALRFPAPDEPGRVARLHGLPDAPCRDVVVVVDSPGWAPLAQALRPWAEDAVHVVVL